MFRISVRSTFLTFFLCLMTIWNPSAFAAEDCDPKKETDNLNTFGCEAQMKLAKCDELFREDPNSPKKRKCEDVEGLKQIVTYGKTPFNCAVGIKDNLGDTAKGIYSYIFEKDFRMPPEMKEREEFFSTCVTGECKRQMLGSYADLFDPKEIEGNGVNTEPDPIKQNAANGLSAKTLYRKLLQKLKSRSEQGIKESFREPWSGKDAALPKNLQEKVDDILKAAGIKDTACYSPATIAEMRCYALMATLDPLIAVKAIGLVGKAAQVGAKIAGSEIAKELGYAARATGSDIKTFAQGAVQSAMRPSVASKFSALKKYPTLTKNIDKTTREILMSTSSLKMETLNDLAKKTAKMAPKELGLSELELRSRLNSLDKDVQSTFLAVQKKLDSPSDFSSYIEKLSADAVAGIERRGDPLEMASLRNGQIPQSAMFRELAQRAQGRGEGVMSIRSGDRGVFRDAVKQGPFVDEAAGLGEGLHGRITHLMQRDYVSDTIAQQTHGNPQKFWDFLGSKKGIHYWVPLFDSFQLVNGSLRSPEFLNFSIRRISPNPRQELGNQ